MGFVVLQTTKVVLQIVLYAGLIMFCLRRFSMLLYGP